MNPHRMQERGISFTSRRPALLEDYKLVFNKKSSRGAFTYANIEPSPGDYIEGALYEFPDHELVILDEKEGYPVHYNRTTLSVKDKNGNSIPATVFFAQPDQTVEGKPTKEFLNHLLAGEDILSMEYFEKLRQMETHD